MINFKINHTKCFAPLSLAKGTMEERMLKARGLNLKFYDNLQSQIKSNEISTYNFAQTLKKTVGTKLRIDVSSTETKPRCNYIADENAIIKGYNLLLPINYLTSKISKSSAPAFLKETQNLLNEVFNPKILKRFTNLAGKKYNVDSIMDFYANNISKKNALSPKILNNFLKNKSNNYKINVLQFLRYKLLSEKNTQKAAFQIDKRIEKHNGLKYERPSDFYDLDKYHYDEKLSLLNQHLADVIKQERK